jgi:hypothetical protein
VTWSGLQVDAASRATGPSNGRGLYSDDRDAHGEAGPPTMAGITNGGRSVERVRISAAARML